MVVGPINAPRPLLQSRTDEIRAPTVEAKPGGLDTKTIKEFLEDYQRAKEKLGARPSDQAKEIAEAAWAACVGAAAMALLSMAMALASIAGSGKEADPAVLDPAKPDELKRLFDQCKEDWERLGALLKAGASQRDLSRAAEAFIESADLFWDTLGPALAGDPHVDPVDEGKGLPPEIRQLYGDCKLLHEKIEALVLRVRQEPEPEPEAKAEALEELALHGEEFRTLVTQLMAKIAAHGDGGIGEPGSPGPGRSPRTGMRV